MGSGKTNICTYGDNSRPIAFSVKTSSWITLSEAVVGCAYATEITANGVTIADYPDVYFDETSLEEASNSNIIAGTDNGKIILYAKNIPSTTLSGAYFIRKGEST